jgi:glycosyltransferase involved in cell wall biosynthesis
LVASLSLIVITRDEERDLPRCLASAPFAEQVIVVDSGSQDRTREVAQAAGAKVLEQPWLGYGPQKAFAFAQATTEWILSLDADEALSPELAQEMPSALQRAEVDGYQLRFRTEMFGRVLRHGGFGAERHLRLFRRERGRMSEAVLHEGVAVPGRVETLGGAVLHRPYADLSEYLSKLDRYTTLAAAQRQGAGRRFSTWSALRLPWGFGRRYLLQLGILDGYAGFLAAALGGVYELLREAKLQELEERTSSS